MTNRKYYTYQDCGCAIELTEEEFAKEPHANDEEIYGTCSACVDEISEKISSNPFEHTIGTLPSMPNYPGGNNIPWSQHQYTYPDPNTVITINDTTNNAVWTSSTTDAKDTLTIQAIEEFNKANEQKIKSIITDEATF